MAQVILLLTSLASVHLPLPTNEEVLRPVVAGDLVSEFAEQQQRIEQMGSENAIYFDAPLSTNQQTYLR